MNKILWNYRQSLYSLWTVFVYSECLSGGDLFVGRRLSEVNCPRVAYLLVVNFTSLCNYAILLSADYRRFLRSLRSTPECRHLALDSLRETAVAGM